MNEKNHTAQSSTIIKGNNTSMAGLKKRATVTAVSQNRLWHAEKRATKTIIKANNTSMTRLKKRATVTVES